MPKKSVLKKRKISCASPNCRFSNGPFLGVRLEHESYIQIKGTKYSGETTIKYDTFWMCAEHAKIHIENELKWVSKKQYDSELER